MEETIFTKIIKGEIPAHKVYEDDLTLAFLDIHPIRPGHVLVIPKEPVASFEELDDKTYDHLFRTVKKTARRIKEVLDPEKVCVRIEGFDVPHAHVHVYPCETAQDFYGDKDRLTKPLDHAALAEMANRLKF